MKGRETSAGEHDLRGPGNTGDNVKNTHDPSSETERLGPSATTDVNQNVSPYCHLAKRTKRTQTIWITCLDIKRYNFSVSENFSYECFGLCLLRGENQSCVYVWFVYSEANGGGGGG